MNWSEQFNRIFEELAVIKAELEYHIKRTDLLEDEVVPILKEHKKEEAIKEYKKHLIKRLSMLVSIIAGIVAIITFFKLG